ncbi:hypothetical protein G4Y79_22090 [Phototrophicus methaneseepsis]|uniref:DUF7282 domain-containing protein n=1 Tax=Phototrophicus methaneseepsis TaxID=2710758 RepID=A0A7S8E8Q5_9CHLR|nr:hypothetical protein [Phototrophicus methaneseepsis]QPC82343.1 hypothetical protein G4Y79_22090 [Phototrophicus methaneseepsis]
MIIRRFVVGMVVAALALLSGSLVMADHFNPAVTVSDQVSTDGTVTVEQVNSADRGFIVIHAADGDSFGEVIGHAPVYPGANYNVVVDIDTSRATSTLYAMLHEDTGEVGTYEFGEVEGADGPVSVDGEVVTPTFMAEVVSAHDQTVDMNSITIDAVTISEDGWVVVHAGDAESFGEVLGFTQVSAGTTTDVTVELDGEMTDVLWPMLHYDTGEAGEYEFGTVEGADGPVAVGTSVATMPIWTVPHIRVADQIVLPGDGMDMMGGSVMGSVLSDGPGFLVIHAATNADDGSLTFGEVIGVAAVEDGYNESVTVELDGVATPIVYPMLHVDTNEIGTYEFGTVEGADGPVVIDGSVVTFPIAAAPSIVYDGTLDGTTLTMDQALIDAPGWLVIHADNGEGSFGAVIGQAQVYPGVNHHISIELNESMMTDTLYPMLHYDTGEAGEYEFGEVEGADLPVTVNGNVVFAAMVPEVAEME